MERPLSAARDALAAGRWAEARAFYENALQHAESAEACEGLSEALWWLNEVTGAIRMRERAYALARASGDAATAIRNATWISRLFAGFGNAAASDGWLARAESLADESGPTVERAYVELMRAKKAADAEAAECHAARALDIARDF